MWRSLVLMLKVHGRYEWYTLILRRIYQVKSLPTLQVNELVYWTFSLILTKAEDKALLFFVYFFPPNRFSNNSWRNLSPTVKYRKPTKASSSMIWTWFSSLARIDFLVLSIVLKFVNFIINSIMSSEIVHF